jgi:hypothetical protein
MKMSQQWMDDRSWIFDTAHLIHPARRAREFTSQSITRHEISAARSLMPNIDIGCTFCRRYLPNGERERRLKLAFNIKVRQKNFWSANTLHSDQKCHSIAIHTQITKTIILQNMDEILEIFEQ